MYLIGAAHAHKIDAQRALERLVTDAEVLQEILHRYTAIGRHDAVHVAVMLAHGIERILSVDTGFDHLPGIRRLAA
jgi:predicted nucleic acid-binding protein